MLATLMLPHQAKANASPGVQTVVTGYTATAYDVSQPTHIIVLGGTFDSGPGLIFLDSQTYKERRRIRLSWPVSDVAVDNTNRLVYTVSPHDVAAVDLHDGHVLFHHTSTISYSSFTVDERDGMIILSGEPANNGSHALRYIMDAITRDGRQPWGPDGISSPYGPNQPPGTYPYARVPVVQCVDESQRQVYYTEILDFSEFGPTVMGNVAATFLIGARDVSTGRSLWTQTLSYLPADVSCDTQHGRLFFLQSEGLAVLSMRTHKFEPHISTGSSRALHYLNGGYAESYRLYVDQGTGNVMALYFSFEPSITLDFFNLHRHKGHVVLSRKVPTSGYGSFFLADDTMRHVAFYVLQSESEKIVYIQAFDMRFGWGAKPPLAAAQSIQVPSSLINNAASETILSGNQTVLLVARSETSTDPNTGKATKTHDVVLVHLSL